MSVLSLPKFLDQADLTPAEKIQGILTHGLTAFDMQLAIISQIDLNTNTYTVCYSAATTEPIPPGAVFDLGQTYCSVTIRFPLPVAIAHASVSEYNRHPCHAAFGLESYIGGTVHHPDGHIGTVNFSSPTPHASFTTAERKLMTDMAAAVTRLLNA